MIPNVKKIGYFYIRQIDEDIQKKLNIEDIYCEIVSELEYSALKDFIVPSWYRNKFNFRELMSNQFESILPMTAEIIPSLMCPLKCEQCSYKPQKQSIGVWDNKHSMLMTSEGMETALRKLNEVNTQNIIITGGGEPLTNAKVTIQGLATAKKYGMVTCLYTNGLLMNESNCQQIIQTNLDVIRISIYGVDEIGFLLYTGTEKKFFKKVFENVNKLIESKIKNQSNISIGLSFLTHPKMFNHINIEKFPFNLFKLLIGMLGKENLSHISTIRFTPAVDYYNMNQHEFNFFEKIYKNIETHIDDFLSYGVTLTPYYHRLNDLYKKKEYDKCTGCGFYAEIGTDGTMYHCCEKLLIEEYAIGNIFEESIHDIYHSNKRMEIINKVNDNIKLCPPVCKPHEINKQLSLVENNDERNIHRYNIWYDSLIEQGKNSKKILSQYNPFES